MRPLRGVRRREKNTVAAKAQPATPGAKFFKVAHVGALKVEVSSFPVLTHGALARRLLYVGSPSFANRSLRTTMPLGSRP